MNKQPTKQPFKQRGDYETNVNVYNVKNVCIVNNVCIVKNVDIITNVCIIANGCIITNVCIKIIVNVCFIELIENVISPSQRNG